MILNDLEQKFKITKDCINFLFANASRGITSEIYHANVIALRFPAVTKYENIVLHGVPDWFCSVRLRVGLTVPRDVLSLSRRWLRQMHVYCLVRGVTRVNEHVVGSAKPTAFHLHPITCRTRIHQVTSCDGVEVINADWITLHRRALRALCDACRVSQPAIMLLRRKIQFKWHPVTQSSIYRS